jgi:hypothetical protein
MIKVCTISYEERHGKLPRGAWTQGWTFEFRAFSTASARTFPGTYSEARKSAIAYAKSNGFSDVILYPATHPIQK